MISNSYKVELEGYREYPRLHYERQLTTLEHDNASLSEFEDQVNTECDEFVNVNTNSE